MTIKWTRIILITLLATGVFFGGYFIGSKFKELQIIKDTVHDTTYVTTTIHDVTKPIFRTITKTDTVMLFDTLRVDKEVLYVAMKDTVYQDSLLTAQVVYLSSMPLDPNSIFDFYFKIKEKTITNTPMVTPTALKSPFGNFHIGVYFGYGLSVFSKSFEPQIGVGVSYTIW